MKPQITVHCIVRNEEKWVWYAVNSILNVAQKVLIYDTGSTDNTIRIIKTIKSKKIIFQEKGLVSPRGLVDLRREQLTKTKTEWFLILDGDEIWPENTKKELVKKISSATNKDLGVVVRAWNLLGDIYHYHPESIYYHWPFAPTDFIGWANLRVIRTSTTGLHIKGEYPLEAYCEKLDTPIQNYGPSHLIFLQSRYFHTTYLTRSSSRKSDKLVLNRSHKDKTELGLHFKQNLKYPQVFYRKRPKLIANPWQKRSTSELLKATASAPFKELRRRLFRLYNP